MFGEANKENAQWSPAEMCCLRIQMSMSHKGQEVTAGPPSSFVLPPPPPPPLSEKKKNRPTIINSKTISAHFCFKRKGKHLLKTRKTKELWVWWTKSLQCLFFSFVGYCSFTSTSSLNPLSEMLSTAFYFGMVQTFTVGMLGNSLTL